MTVFNESGQVKPSQVKSSQVNEDEDCRRVHVDTFPVRTFDDPCNWSRGQLAVVSNLMEPLAVIDITLVDRQSDTCVTFRILDDSVIWTD